MAKVPPPQHTSMLLAGRALGSTLRQACKVASRQYVSTACLPAEAWLALLALVLCTRAGARGKMNSRTLVDGPVCLTATVPFCLCRERVVAERFSLPQSTSGLRPEELWAPTDPRAVKWLYGPCFSTAQIPKASGVLYPSAQWLISHCPISAATTVGECLL